MDTYIYIAIAIVFIIIILISWHNSRKQESLIRELINRTTSENNQDFQALKKELNQELYLFQNEMQRSFREDLNLLNVTTSSSLDNVKENVNKGLSSGFNKTNEAFLEMSKQLVSIDETQKHLSTLSKDIVALQNILTDKKTRGIYGEIELYSILKTAYGLDDNAYQKQYKLSNNSIADVVILAPKPLNKIVVDSKFPLENYLGMHNSDLTKKAQAQAKKQFKRDIIKHINDIANKYIIKGETAEMAFMFIPAEAIFAEIYGQFEDVVQYSYKANVYLVSPTTLMAYITAMKAIYLGQKQNAKVDLIQDEFNRLAVEFERFEKRYKGLMNSFERTYREMNDVNITTNKIINRFKDIEAVELDRHKEQD